MEWKEKKERTNYLPHCISLDLFQLDHSGLHQSFLEVSQELSSFVPGMVSLRHQPKWSRLQISSSSWTVWEKSHWNLFGLWKPSRLVGDQNAWQCHLCRTWHVLGWTSDQAPPSSRIWDQGSRWKRVQLVYHNKHIHPQRESKIQGTLLQGFRFKSHHRAAVLDYLIEVNQGELSVLWQHFLDGFLDDLVALGDSFSHVGMRKEGFHDLIVHHVDVLQSGTAHFVVDDLLFKASFLGNLFDLGFPLGPLFLLDGIKERANDEDCMGSEAIRSRIRWKMGTERSKPEFQAFESFFALVHPPEHQKDGSIRDEVVMILVVFNLPSKVPNWKK